MKTLWTLLALALLALGSQSIAQTQRTLGPPEERGAFLYQFHCAGCHGEEGRSDGPVAEPTLTWLVTTVKFCTS